MTTSVVIIEELAGRKRRLELRGGGLPLQGAEWADKTALNTQWNPGNPEATQHVLGPQELPSTWDGEWRTTQMIATPSKFNENGGSDLDVVLADSMRDLFEAIGRSGQLLRVTWVAKENRRVSRLGRMGERHFKHKRADDIAWSVEFEWIGRGDGQQAASEFKGDNLLARTRELQAAADDAISALTADQIINANQQVAAATNFTLGQLENFLDGPRQLFAQFAQFANAISNRARHLGELVLKIRDTPANLLGQAADVATNAIAVSNQFVDAVSRESPETMSASNKVSAMLKASSYYGSGETQAELMTDTAVKLARAARRRKTSMQQGSTSSGIISADDILTVHRPRDGETMVSISNKYYQADLSFELSRANGLPGSTIVPPPTALIIPTKEVLNKMGEKKTP